MLYWGPGPSSNLQSVYHLILLFTRFQTRRQQEEQVVGFEHQTFPHTLCRLERKQLSGESESLLMGADMPSVGLESCSRICTSLQ